MAKDRLGNSLEKGDRLCIALPEAQIFGFVAEVKEQGVIRGVRGGAETTPGAVLVSCVIALPLDPKTGQIPQCVKVYDPEKREDAAKIVQPN